MNHLFQDICWTAYLSGMIILFLAYYLFIGARFFAGDLRDLFNRLTGHKAGTGGLPAVLQYQEQGTRDEIAATTPVDGNSRQVREAPTDTDHLSIRLKACISTAADKPFAPAVLIAQLKRLLQEHYALAASAERPAINALIVNECEKTGTALLTEEEVDQWWSA
jgi:hypothetical protein